MSEVHDFSTLIQGESIITDSSVIDGEIDFSKLLRVVDIDSSKFHSVISEEAAMRIYKFVSDWKSRKYGDVSLQDAIDENLDDKFYIKKHQ